MSVERPQIPVNVIALEGWEAPKFVHPCYVVHCCVTFFEMRPFYATGVPQACPGLFEIY